MKDKVKLNDDKYVDVITDIPKNRPNMTKEDGLNLNKCTISSNISMIYKVN
jgi:hypothetical protein